MNINAFIERNYYNILYSLKSEEFEQITSKCNLHVTKITDIVITARHLTFDWITILYYIVIPNKINNIILYFFSLKCVIVRTVNIVLI